MSKRIDNTGFGDIRVIQDPDTFCYGIDAVLLADFASQTTKKYETAVDLGTGNGIIPLILSYKYPDTSLTGIEIQSDVLELAIESSRLNGLEDRLRFLNMDVTEVPGVLPAGSAGFVTCNPPYFAKGAGIVNDEQAKFVARQETSATVDDFIRAASHLLEKRGHMYMIHRPGRITDILCACRAYSLEPKKIQFVSPREGKAPNLVLIDCIKGGGKDLIFLPELHVYDSDGKYTDEIMEIYERKR